MTSRQLSALLAVVQLHRQGPVTVRKVAAALGVGSTVAYKHLRVLRDNGLVAWEPRLGATIHPLVGVATKGDRSEGSQVDPER